jgi:hypothetical protein
MNNSSHSTATDVDLDKVIEMALRVRGYKQGEVVSLMIHLGDQLWLYRALQGAGPVTAVGLADRAASAVAAGVAALPGRRRADRLRGWRGLRVQPGGGTAG